MSFISSQPTLMLEGFDADDVFVGSAVFCEDGRWKVYARGFGGNDRYAQTQAEAETMLQAAGAATVVPDREAR